MGVGWQRQTSVCKEVKVKGVMREVTCAGLVTAGENRHHLVNSGPAMETLSLLLVETDPCQHLFLYKCWWGKRRRIKVTSVSFFL